MIRLHHTDELSHYRLFLLLKIKLDAFSRRLNLGELTILDTMLEVILRMIKFDMMLGKAKI